MRTFRFALAFLAVIVALNWSIAQALAGGYGYGQQVTSANVVLNDMDYCASRYQYAAPAAQLNVVARQVTPAYFTLMPYQPQAELPAIQPQVSQPMYAQPASTVQFQLSQPAYSYSTAVVQPQINAYSYGYGHSFNQNLNAGGYGGFNQNVNAGGYGHSFNQQVRFNQVGRHRGFNQRLNVRSNVRVGHSFNQSVVTPAVVGVGNQTIKTKTVNRQSRFGNRQVSKTKTVIRNR